MYEVIKQSEQYPEWMKAWNAKAAEIDQEIINYCSTNAEQTSEALDNIGTQLRTWWDKQHMDDVTRAEWEKAKADAALYKAQVENRYQHLLQDGKIAWAKKTEKLGD